MRKSFLVLAVTASFAASCNSTSSTQSQMSLFDAGISAEHMVVDGAQHERMSQLIGTWSTTSTFWDRPSRRAGVESQGSCEYAWNEQGNLLIGQHAGEMMGAGFAGASVLGYDSLAGGYVSSWADSEGNMLRPMQLVCCQDDSGNFQVERVTDGGVVRELMTMQGADAHLYEMHRKSDSGQEWCMLRIVYTRQPEQTQEQ